MRATVDSVIWSSSFVVYWKNIPSPYMVECFNALAGCDAFEFEAWFNDHIESDRSWDVDESGWRFRHCYLPTSRLLGRTQHWPLPALGRLPDVLVSPFCRRRNNRSTEARACRCHSNLNKSSGAVLQLARFGRLLSRGDIELSIRAM